MYNNFNKRRKNEEKETKWGRVRGRGGERGGTYNWSGRETYWLASRTLNQVNPVRD